jgi:fatty acid desaturase
MNENAPCTTSSALQTFTGLLYLAAIVLALALILCAA